MAKAGKGMLAPCGQGSSRAGSLEGQRPAHPSFSKTHWSSRSLLPSSARGMGREGKKVLELNPPPHQSKTLNLT